MPVDRALQHMLDDVALQEKIVNTPIRKALGCVLAENIVSSLDVPPTDNSAMDGYVVNMADVSEGETRLPISQRIAAGFYPEPLQAGTAARIFTGAVIPETANAVIMQEQCKEEDGYVVFDAAINERQNIRPLGQDIATGSVVLEKGTRLRPQDLGLLASVGRAEVKVFQPLKIAILSTGDELLEPGEPNERGKIYNSNRYTLIGLIAALGFECVDLGVVEDTLAATKAALEQAAEQADAIITTGGVSVGEEDHVKAAINDLGSLQLWRLAIKPGKPLAYGDVNGTPAICLPGNPAAAFVTFCIAARPYLLKKQGAKKYLPQLLQAQAGFEWPKAGKRQEYLRCRLENKGNVCSIALYPNQSSGVLSSASWADILAIIPINGTVKAGDKVDFYNLTDLLN